MTQSRRPVELLLVEDNQAEVDLMREVMSDREALLHLHTVGDGEAAMAFLRQTGKHAGAVRPDLILLDLNLPGKHGAEVLAEIKADPGLKSIPVVILTTSASEVDVARSYHLQASSFITKPLNLDQFTRVVEAIQDYWLSAARLPLGVHLAMISEPQSLPLTSVTALGTMRILLVEDNPADVGLMREMLSDLGPDVMQLSVVGSRAAAIERLGREAFDVLLLDLFLPDSRGVETFTRLQFEAPQLPVVVLSGLDDEETALRTLQVGAQDYLVKNQLGAPLLRRALRYAVERKRLEQTLRQAQKLQVVGQLAGGIAHDFNNLMTVVMGQCDMLIMQMGAEPERVGRLIQIKAAGERAAALTAQLLAFSRKQVLRPGALNPETFLQRTVTLLRTLLTSRIAVKLEVEPGVKNVRVDPTQLDQVLVNLAVNARDAMPAAGTLTIRVRNVNLTPGTAPDGVMPGAYVEWEVEDTGTGMDAATLAKIFEPFFTTKEVGRGTGLGLATVYGIIEQSGGHIEARSTPGVGTTFRFCLPQVDDAAERASGHARPLTSA